MSKQILLSIRPQWVEKILNGDKTIEVRKRFPKEYKGLVYIYCTKGELLQRHWQKVDGIGKFITYGRKAKEKDYNSPHTLNGKVIGRFYCDNVEEIKYKIGCPFPYLDFESELPKTCLTDEELEDYLFTKKGYQNGYAIHISKLEIFDKPKELSEFNSWVVSEETYLLKKFTKAPQNYYYIKNAAA